ncbi:hypothetical protein L6452_41583 [Arctium lappa]|uniref:Uncharacterized protein n=1 Tax=Arctium lappa TaxID=4217 RepID=A0ACB8XPR7_ARCLA|nr:hypothetical protein L6452_41583 [Arctium lappa]
MEVSVIRKKKIDTYPPEINEEHQQIRFPYYLLLLFLITVVLFVDSYRRKKDYSLAVIGLGMVLEFLLTEHILPAYRYLPPDEKKSTKIWFKLAIWFLSTALVLVLAFWFPNLWSFQRAVAFDLVVLVLSLFLLYAWIIDDVVDYWKIWRSGKDEIDVAENTTIEAGK